MDPAAGRLVPSPDHGDQQMIDLLTLWDPRHERQ
jgi:hypothetical protein